MSSTTPPPRRARNLALACALLASCASVVGCAGSAPYDRPPAFHAYPPNAALDRVIVTHQEAGTDPKEARLLLTTWFLNGDPRVAQFCSVFPDGRRVTYQYVMDVASNAVQKVQLPPQTLRVLADAIAQLPPSAEPRPPLANLLIVSFRQGDAWETRLYDRTNRPPSVSTIFGATNAPVVP